MPLVASGRSDRRSLRNEVAEFDDLLVRFGIGCLDVSAILERGIPATDGAPVRKGSHFTMSVDAV